MSQSLRRAFIALFCVVSLLIGCDGGSDTVRLPTNSSILAFGDSLTEGYGVTPEFSYPTVLAEITGHRVVNAGISGEVTEDGLARFADVVAQTDPALVILIEGGNDILRKKDLLKTKQNLAAMIQIAQGRDIPVILIGIPERSLFSSSAPLYSELAEQFDLPFDGKLIASLLKSPKFKSDAIHFNKAGYRKMAEGIAKLIESGN